jgi:hypothetical protein
MYRSINSLCSPDAKLTEYQKQCWHLAGLVRNGILDRATAVDMLHEIAIRHSLIRAHGEDRIQAIIAEAFAGADLDPLYAERAA